MVHRARETEGTSQRVGTDAISEGGWFWRRCWYRHRDVMRTQAMHESELPELPTTTTSDTYADWQNWRPWFAWDHRADGATWPEWL